MRSSWESYQEEIRPLALVDGTVDPRRRRARRRLTSLAHALVCVVTLVVAPVYAVGTLLA